MRLPLVASLGLLVSPALADPEPMVQIPQAALEALYEHHKVLTQSVDTLIEALRQEHERVLELQASKNCS